MQIQLPMHLTNLNATDNDYVYRLWREETNATVKEASQFASNKQSVKQDARMRQQNPSPAPATETLSLRQELDTLKSLVDSLQNPSKDFRWPANLRGRGCGCPRGPPRDPFPRRGQPRAYSYTTPYGDGNKLRSRLKKPNSSNSTNKCIKLSCINLSTIEKRLLCDGLSFIPKPKRIHLHNLYRDTNKFVSSIRYQNKHHSQTAKPKSFCRAYRYTCLHICQPCCPPSKCFHTRAIGNSFAKSSIICV